MSDSVRVAGWWNRIPGTARGQAALSFWDVAWSGATAYPIGTAYASMTDSSAAITTAIAKAITLGVPVRGSGRFRVDAKVTINCDADFTGAEFVCSSTSLNPVVVGSESSGVLVRRLSVVLPKVFNAAKTGTGWTGSNAGVTLSNLYNSNVDIPHIQSFPVGLLLSSLGTGTASNHIRVGHLDNNKVNCKLLPGTAGWVNQNSFYDGQYSHDSAEGSAVSGSRHVLIQGASGLQPNANRWFGASLESPLNPSVVEYVIESVAGIYNRFYDCRYEVAAGATPKVYFNEIDATYYSRDNTINEGYNASAIVFTQSTNSIRNRYWSEFENVVHASSSTIPAIRFGNAASDAGPQIEGVDLTVDALVAVTGDWRWRLTANALALKAKADTVARLSISTALGVMSWASGSATADTNLYRNGVNQLKTDDQFVAADGIVTKAVAGIPVDGDLTVVSNNVILIDTSNNRIYVRVGGSWKYAALT